MLNNRPGIYFHFPNKKFSFSQRRELKEFISRLFKQEKTRLGGLYYIFCSDKYLLDINREFLKHDYYTDIITFDLSVSDSVSGEIYISIDRVRENARNMGLSFALELHRVMFHGALHLCGYNDKTKKDKARMSSREDFYLALFKKK